METKKITLQQKQNGKSNTEHKLVQNFTELKLQFFEVKN